MGYSTRMLVGLGERRGIEAMYKSILAISEGGPDAAMSFGLAARIASMFGAHRGCGSFFRGPPRRCRYRGPGHALSQIPVRRKTEGARAEFERAFRELIAPIEGATFTGGQSVTRDQLVTMGRYASLVLLGRPGMDAENIAPATVKAAIYDCARPVVIAPPDRAERADLVGCRCLERQRAGRACRRIRPAVSRESARGDDRRRRRKAR